MIVNYIPGKDRPAEIAIYYTPQGFDEANAGCAEAGLPPLDALGPDGQRKLCRLALDQKADTETPPTRSIVEIGGGVVFDSKDVGMDIARAMRTESDMNTFNPDYHPVDLTIRVFSAAGALAVESFAHNHLEEDLDKVYEAARSASLVAIYNLRPPGLA